MWKKGYLLGIKYDTYPIHSGCTDESESGLIQSQSFICALQSLYSKVISQSCDAVTVSLKGRGYI